MTEDFNLSDYGIKSSIPCPDAKIGCAVYHYTIVYPENKMREAVRLLKENITYWNMASLDDVIKEIDKIFGDKLINQLPSQNIILDRTLEDVNKTIPSRENSPLGKSKLDMSNVNADNILCKNCNGDVCYECQCNRCEPQEEVKR